MWEISLSAQVVSFLYAILVGLILSLIFDFFRAIRIYKTYSKTAIFFQDITFWLFFTFITFLLLMARSNGEVRGYILIGELIGFFLFRILLSPFVLKIMLFALKILAKVSALYKVFIEQIACFFTDLFEKVRNMIIKKQKK